MKYAIRGQVVSREQLREYFTALGVKHHILNYNSEGYYYFREDREGNPGVGLAYLISEIQDLKVKGYSFLIALPAVEKPVLDNFFFI